LIATGLLYQPYYVLTAALAATIVWTCPQAWDITRTITWPRAVGCVVVLWVATAVLFTQSYNPFIYFIF
jgi:alginate O-acetyltransferase complex protein AlgI